MLSDAAPQRSSLARGLCQLKRHLGELKIGGIELTTGKNLKTMLSDAPPQPPSLSRALRQFETAKNYMEVWELKIGGIQSWGNYAKELEDQALR
mmetsp:Transcript_23676/g.37795  ORF Transcript_23676/g.37795 Transcript_23676/m.37795 type:complete len:94 (+) Transcript_23676:168-449(+)